MRGAVSKGRIRGAGHLISVGKVAEMEKGEDSRPTNLRETFEFYV